MRVQYKTTYWDVLRFSISHAIRSPWYQLAHGLFALWMFWSEIVMPDAGFMVAFLVGFAWWLAVWMAVFFVNAFAIAGKKNKTMFVEHNMEITDEGLFEQTKFNKSLFYWPGIVKIAQRAGFIAVYISGHQAHVIPKRFFASKAEMNEFRRLVEHHIQAAKSAS